MQRKFHIFTRSGWPIRDIHQRFIGATRQFIACNRKKTIIFTETTLLKRIFSWLFFPELLNHFKNNKIKLFTNFFNPIKIHLVFDKNARNDLNFRRFWGIKFIFYLNIFWSIFRVVQNCFGWSWKSIFFFTYVFFRDSKQFLNFLYVSKIFFTCFKSYNFQLSNPWIFLVKLIIKLIMKLIIFFDFKEFQNIKKSVTFKEGGQRIAK